MELTSSNYKHIAKKHYISTEHRTMAEFNEDLNRVNHIIRSLKRVDEPSFNPRVLINQVIVFFNVFSVVGGVQMVEFKIGKDAKLLSRFAAVCYVLGKMSIDQHGYLDQETKLSIEEELRRGVK